MKGTFSEIIRGSWEWTKTVLFRPFSLKKWIFLCIIAICAAEISGCNINLNLNLPAERPKEEIVQEEMTNSVEEESVASTTAGIELSIWLILAILVVAIIGFVLFILLMWIYSRFSFIFLNSIVKNDASIKGPFRENKNVGNSFFKWNISVFFVFVGVMVLCVSLLVGSMYLFRNVNLIWKILLIIIPLGFIIMAVFLAFCIVNLIVRDLVLPVMFKDRVSVFVGLKEIWPIIKGESIDFIKYILIKVGLRILAAIGAGFFTAAVIFALLIQMGIVGGLLYSASFLLPSFLRLGYYGMLILLAIICFIGILILINLALLPIPVYFRTFSLKFLARLDERYDLFRLKPGEEE